VLRYYQTKHLLMKCSSFCDDTVGIFFPFFVVYMFFSSYDILNLVIPYLFSSIHYTTLFLKSFTGVNVVMCWYFCIVCAIFFHLFFCAPFLIGKMCTSTGTVLFTGTVLLFCTVFICSCLSTPVPLFNLAFAFYHPSTVLCVFVPTHLADET
jgi:hypothetical protein